MNLWKWNINLQNLLYHDLHRPPKHTPHYHTFNIYDLCTSLSWNVNYQHTVLLLWGRTDEVGIRVLLRCTTVIHKVYLRKPLFTKRNVIYSIYDLRNQLRISNIPTSDCDIINKLQPEEEFWYRVRMRTAMQNPSRYGHTVLQTCSKYDLAQRSKITTQIRGFPNDRISRTVQNSQKTCWNNELAQDS